MQDKVLKIFNSVKHLSSICGEKVNQMVSKKFEKSTKADQSFVTEVDLEIEKIFRDYVTSNFPDHGIIGEENGDINPLSKVKWVIDPIDGTQNLVHGIPTYGIVMGVFWENENIAGAINHPALNLEYLAAKGLGCYRNGQKIRIEDCILENHEIDPQEVIALSTRSVFSRSSETKIFDDLVSKYPSHRVYYDIFSTTRAIEGQVAAVVEFNMKIWDIAATEVLIKEAGGSYKVVREHTLDNSKKMYSIIAGKPSAVKILSELV